MLRIGDYMKRLLFIMMLFVLTLSLVACEPATYDDVFSAYQTYLTDHSSDYDDLMETYNTINQDIVYATVTVKNYIAELSFSSIGSGVIFDEDDTSYYVMTNSHVIGGDSSYIHAISIIDIEGTSYDGTLIAYETSYDLAVVKFTKTEKTLRVMDMAMENLNRRTPIIVLGHPDGQVNAITLGYFIEMTEISMSDSSIGQIDFEVYRLDSPVQPGSSGSVVINESYQMVGLIFAGNFDEDDGQTNYAYAIPIESVYEFLELHPIGGEET